MGVNLDNGLQSSEARTVVLVGRTGNGKSATGNSILGDKVFKSKLCPSGVTVTSEMQTTTELDNGRILNVIDTPGLFDVTTGDTEFIGKEIVKCIQLAEDGIHAVLIVLSLRNRFSIEEKEAVRYILKFFGSKITDYMIVLITGGDELEESDQTMEDYLGIDCPEPLKDILDMCGNKYVVFDNRTKNKVKKDEQRNQLLKLIEEVLDRNGGKPYTSDLFHEMKDGVKFLENEAKNSPAGSSWDEDEARLRRRRDEIFFEIVEAKLKETTRYFELLLEDERNNRHQIEKNAAQAQLRADEELRELREALVGAVLERKQRERVCAIM